MLTPTDIHYLVGLLILSSSPDDVDIVLGDLVPDQATGTSRDVDVTITCKKPDGSVRAFKGMEVKDHSRPLDVAMVEQLCIKFKDMPSVTHRAIVSASGYTGPAIKKAIYHGVELWHLKPWDDPSRGFDHVRFPADLHFTQSVYQWQSLDHVRFNPTQELSPEARMAVSQNPRVCDQDGNDLPNCADLNALSGQLAQNALNDSAMQGERQQIGPGEIKKILHYFLLALGAQKSPLLSTVRYGHYFAPGLPVPSSPGVIPALMPVLIFRPRAIVWLCCMLIPPALTFVLFFIFLPLGVDIERYRHVLGVEYGDNAVYLYRRKREVELLATRKLYFALSCHPIPSPFYRTSRRRVEEKKEAGSGPRLEVMNQVGCFLLPVTSADSPPAPLTLLFFSVLSDRR